MNWQSHMASAPSFPLWRRKRRRWIGAADAWLLLALLLVLRFPQRLAERLPREVALKADRQLEPLLVAKRENGNNNDRTEDEEAAAAEGNLVGLDPEEEEEQTSSSRPSRNESPSQLFMDPTFQRPRQQLFYLSDEGPPTQAFISSKSWDDYQRFKEETCRKDGAEESLAGRSLNSTESGYFHWEQNEFHRQLRGRLLPQTRGGSFRSLVGSQLLHRLDPRLFASEPRTLCKAKRHISEADERQKMAKEEQHMFEDFLINKVLPVDMFAPRRSANTNATTAGGRRV